MYSYDVMRSYAIEVDAIAEGSLAIWGYSPKSGITDAGINCFFFRKNVLHQSTFSLDFGFTVGPSILASSI